MRTPSKEIPEPEQGERFTDVAKDKLIVIEKGWKKVNLRTSFGDTDAVRADVWVYDTADKPNAWTALGETPIFSKTVARQLEETGPGEETGAVLHQGTNRPGGRPNPNEWVLLPPNKEQEKILAEWDPSF